MTLSGCITTPGQCTSTGCITTPGRHSEQVPARASSAVTRSSHLGVWRSLVARFVRDEEVAGSNPVTPTL